MTGRLRMAKATLRTGGAMTEAEVLDSICRTHDRLMEESRSLDQQVACNCQLADELVRASKACIARREAIVRELDALHEFLPLVTRAQKGGAWGA